MTICRIVGEVYLNEEDYQNASSVAKTALELLKKIEQESGKNLHKCVLLVSTPCITKVHPDLALAFSPFLHRR